jgi:hypothetical protein
MMDVTTVLVLGSDRPPREVVDGAFVLEVRRTDDERVDWVGWRSHDAVVGGANEELRPIADLDELGSAGADRRVAVR